MGLADSGPALTLETLYAQSREVDIAAFVRGLEPLGDEILAEIIEADGRALVAGGKPIELSRYLNAVPDLRSRLLALDAAIDMTLRSLRSRSVPDHEAVLALWREYPDLGQAIREASFLDDAVCSTAALAERLNAPEMPRSLPSEFGPVLADGARRYSLTRALGKGSQGEVYLAEDRHLSEPDRPALVALKVLFPRVIQAFGRVSLLEEATKARRVNHPNVVRVLDRGVTDQGEDYIVYEYVPGGDLASLVATEDLPLDARRAVGLMAQVARGVHSAHSAGLVHCDLKPSNILMDGETAKVADFGVADRLNPKSPEPDGPSSVGGNGNLAFVSPERFRGMGSATIPSDIYSLGGLLFFLLSGRLPHGSTLHEVAKNHARTDGAASSLRSLCVGTDRDLDSVCPRALSRDASLRHQSAGEFADDLEKWLRHEPIGWTRPSPLRRLLLLRRRRPVTSVLVAALGLGLAAAAAVGIKLRDDAQDQKLARLVEQARTEAHNESLRSTLRQFIAYMEKNRGGDVRMGSTILCQGLLMQWSMGPDFFGDITKMPELWRDRIRLARAVREPGGSLAPNSLEGLLWDSSMAFWLTCSGLEQEALGVLDQDMLAWRKKLDPGDPWLAQLESLRACAFIRGRLKLASPDGDGDAAGVRDAEQLLLREREVFGPNKDPRSFRGPDEATALHRLVLQTLIDLYGSTLRADPDLHAKAVARLEEYNHPAHQRQ